VSDGMSLADRYQEAALRMQGELDDHDRHMIEVLGDPVQTALLAADRSCDNVALQLRGLRHQRFGAGLTWLQLAWSMGIFGNEEEPTVLSLLAAGADDQQLPPGIRGKVSGLRNQVETYETGHSDPSQRWLARYAAGLGRYIDSTFVDITDDATWQLLGRRFQ
jgi:hypothetical protein